MGRINWDRARRDAMVARSSDYSARMDAAESTLWDRPAKTQQRPKRGPSKEQLRRDAAALGLAPSVLKRRRAEFDRRPESMAAEARRRGIKVRELRRLIERGEAKLPRHRQPADISSCPREHRSDDAHVRRST